MHYSRMRTARSSSRLLGGGCLETPLGVCLETPLGVGLETHLGVGLETSPGVGLVIPPGCGLGDPPDQTAQLPPPHVLAWRSPRPDPSTSPLGVGLETCNAYWDTPPSWTDRHM